MTPLALEMLVWFHTRAQQAGPFPNIQRGPQTEIVLWFTNMDIIKPWDDDLPDDTYRTTERGAAWLELILQTPFPTRVWVDPREHAAA